MLELKRRLDVEDIVQLARRLGCKTTEGLLQLVKHYYPDEQVLPEKIVEIRNGTPSRQRKAASA
jgi:hypothetical protein